MAIKILTLTLVLLTLSQSSASTLLGTSGKIYWTGEVPAGEEGQLWDYTADLYFTRDFKSVLVSIDTGHPLGGDSWVMQQSPMNTADTVYYSDGGYSANLELHGNFTQELNDSNYKSLLSSATVVWWPDHANPENFVSSLRGEGLLYQDITNCLHSSPKAFIVPEPGSLALLLISLFFFRGRRLL